MKLAREARRRARSKVLRWLSALTTFVVVPLFCAAASYASTSDPSHKLSGLTAQLYYSDKGSLSENVIGNSKFEFLFNTIIGEGAAEGHSNSTLVTVVVAGKPGSFRTNSNYKALAKIELTAFEGRKVLHRAKSDVGIIGKQGKWYFPVLIYETGCAPLRLVAILTDSGKVNRLERTINFHCGE